MRLTDELIWPAVAIHPTVTEQSEIGLGQSRFGGMPDTTSTFKWPRWRDRPLAFLAQLNLSDLVGYSCSIKLPERGWLLFFFDPDQEAWGFKPEDQGCSHVEFIEPNERVLVRQPIPTDMPASGHFNVAALQFKPISTRPDPWSIWVDALSPSSDERFELAEEISSEVESFDGTMHQIGGHPSPIQGAMEEKCQLVTNGLNCGEPSVYESEMALALKPGASEWRCLLQIDSDDDIGWMWGDVGQIYFWIKEVDIQERQFSRSWLILQCS